MASKTDRPESALDGLLLGAFRAGLAAVHPQKVLPAALPSPPRGRTIVLGAGKASGAMARVVEDLWPAPLTGLVVVPHGYLSDCEQVTMLEASHPVPDDFGCTAAQQMLRLAQDLTDDDLVLALFSGGGSSLLPLPAGSVTLEDKRSITRRLLESGAPISDINCLRKHLSAIKGGRLALAAWPARVANILISDVAGDNPSLIASGPGVSDSSTLREAREVVDKYHLQISDAARRHLADPENETPKPDDPVFARVSVDVVASSRAFLEAAAAFFEERGIPAHILSDSLQGEAREVARSQAALLARIARRGRPFTAPCALLSGGETTVTVRGGGRGGPNMEFLLALAAAIAATSVHTGRFAAIACDSDGMDGSTTAAGALLRPDTGARAARAGLDPCRFLEANDSQTFFEALGDLVVTGPTHNNVNDFRALLVLRD